MTYLVVIDTNVLVSALLSKHEDASTVQIINAVFSGKIIPVFNNEILAEYDTVLHRPKFKFPDKDIHNLLSAIYENGLFSEQLSTGVELPDSKDKEPFIVTPNEFLKLIQ